MKNLAENKIIVNSSQLKLLPDMTQPTHSINIFTCVCKINFTQKILQPITNNERR